MVLGKHQLYVLLPAIQVDVYSKIDVDVCFPFTSLDTVNIDYLLLSST